MTFSRRWKRPLSYAVLIAAGMVSSSRADNLTYSFQGTVTSVFDPTGFFGSSVTIGNVIDTSFFSSAQPVAHPIVDSSLAYWTQFAPTISTASFNAGSLAMGADAGGWSVQAYDSHQAGVEDRLTFYAFQIADHHDYAAYWDVALVGEATEFPSDQFRDDWTSVVSAAEYPKMYIQLSISQKVWTGDSYTFDFNTPLARLGGSVTNNEFPASTVPVPEASTYGWVSALLLGFAIIRKKFRTRQ